MADDVQDIYVSTGSGAEWQSLSALAAEQVDASLPISSDDDTVVLDSPSANVFTVSTGGGTTATVDSSGLTVNSDDITPLEITSTSDSCYLRLQANGNPAAFFGFYGEDITLSAGVGGAIQLRITPDEAVKVPTQLQTSTVKGLVDTDAQIDLGANFSVSAGGSIRQQVLANGQFQIVAAGSISNPALCFGFLNLGISFLAGTQTGGLDDDDAGFVFSAPKTSVNNTPNELLRIRRDKQIVAADDYTPKHPNCIATKKIVDDKIWVGTTSEYLALDIRDILPTTLYCLTD